MLRRPQPASRPASTCPASRRSSTRRSTPSSSARRCAPRASPPTSPSSVRERQDGMRAEVSIAARYPETVPAPVSGLPTQEIYTLFGTAVASERGTRTLTGVEAQGMTACPCAQGLVDGRRPRAARSSDGFTAERDRRDRRGRPGRHPQPARHRHPLHRLPRGRRASTSTRREPAAHRRELDVERDLRADEALRRARRGREGPRQPPLRRGLRARDDPPGRPRPSPSSATAPSSWPARRTSRRSTATTWSPSATACSRRSRAELDERRALAPPHDDARVARGAVAAASEVAQASGRPERRWAPLGRVVCAAASCDLDPRGSRRSSRRR